MLWYARSGDKCDRKWGGLQSLGVRSLFRASSSKRCDLASTWQRQCRLQEYKDRQIANVYGLTPPPPPKKKKLSHRTQKSNWSRLPALLYLDILVTAMTKIMSRLFDFNFQNLCDLKFLEFEGLTQGFIRVLFGKIPDIFMERNTVGLRQSPL